jgi:hypothetical protein
MMAKICAFDDALVITGLIFTNVEELKTFPFENVSETMLG